MKLRFWLLPAALLLLGAAEPPSRPALLPPAEGARRGRELVEQILLQQPVENLKQSGRLKIRDAAGRRSELPVTFEVLPGENSWTNLYVAGDPAVSTLRVRYAGLQPNVYELEQGGTRRTLSGNETMIPFAGSDFWVADLGLEFFHWPNQRLLKTEMRRGQSCRVLESTNPNPAPGAYGRVVCWIDIDSNGIVHADAYDSRDELWKQFDPKEFKKVRGHWQLQEMEITNRQTDSRTQIEFSASH